MIGRLSVRPYETRDGEKRQSVDIDAMAVGPELGRATTIIKRVERSVQPSAAAGSASPIADDHGPTTDGSDGDDGPEGDLVAPDGIDWGISLGEPFGESRGGVVGDVSHMDEDGTGRVIDPFAAGADLAQTAELAEPVAQLASTGGRWRSRSAS